MGGGGLQNPHKGEFVNLPVIPAEAGNLRVKLASQNSQNGKLHPAKDPVLTTRDDGVHLPLQTQTDGIRLC